MPVTLCGKCGKPEPSCDCRPLAVKSSMNTNVNHESDAIPYIINFGTMDLMVKYFKSIGK